MKPTSKNAKELTCWKRFGVLVLFATSGMNNVVSARCAIQKSPGSQAGAFITASHVRWVVRQLLATAFYFIPSAMTGFIVSVFPFRNRVSFREAFEGLELGERKLSRPVLRGPGGRKVAWLLGSYARRSTRHCLREDLVHLLPYLLTARWLQIPHSGLHVRMTEPLLYGAQIDTSP